MHSLKLLLAPALGFAAACGGANKSESQTFGGSPNAGASVQGGNNSLGGTGTSQGGSTPFGGTATTTGRIVSESGGSSMSGATGGLTSKEGGGGAVTAGGNSGISGGFTSGTSTITGGKSGATGGAGGVSSSATGGKVGSTGGTTNNTATGGRTSASGGASTVATGGTVSTTGGVGTTGGTSTGGNSATAGSSSVAMAGWVLSYFGPEQSVAADSLHLAYSTDGLHWTRLGSGGPAYQLTGLGTNHIRDPFILRKQDGSFVYLATDWTLSNNDSNYWNNPSSKILVADSKDLKTFTNPRLLTLTSLKGPSNTPMHAWAPEGYFDAATQQYAIIWSGNDSTDSNRIYISYTKDFVTLESTDPAVLFDPGYSIIDGTFTSHNGVGYLFFKDETDNSGTTLTGSGKDIQVARAASDSLAPGAFSRWDANYITRGTNQSTRQATEGPFIIKDPKQNLWYLYADFYTQNGVFGCWSTTNLGVNPNAWTRVASANYSLPAGVRHANTVLVTQAELDAVIAYYANK
jgi:hypothetical protein